MSQASHSIGTIIKAAQVALFALICFFVVKALMVWMNPGSVWKAPQNLATVGTTTAKQTTVQKTYDYKYDPFHRNKPKVAVEEPVDTGEDAPETTLNLKLTGLISGENGRVTIKSANNKQDSYGIGDEITDGVTLKSIFPDFIILSRNGKNERLTFERDESELTEKSQSKARSTSTGASQALSGMSPDQIIKAISFQKVSNNSRTLGFKISAAPGLDIKQLGFRNGDIISRIGGDDLTQNGADIHQSIIKAVASGNTTAKITRRGRKMTIRVKLP